MTEKILAAIAVLLVAAVAIAQNTAPGARPRARDLGLKVGILPTGPLDAITDVAGVEIGQTTIIQGTDVRTGVTAILPHPAICSARRCRARFSWVTPSASWRVRPK